MQVSSLQVPKITIAIPAYKPTYLEEALRSVLEQDFTDYEVVVCHDGPNEEVVGIIQAYVDIFGSDRLRYSRNEKRLYGGGTLGRCIDLARGEYIKPVFDDDLLLPGCLEALAATLDSYPDVSLASSRRRLIDENGNSLPDAIFNILPFDEDSILHGKDLVSFFGDATLNFIGEPATVMFRRKQIVSEAATLFHLGGEAIGWVGDLAMYVKLLRKGHLAMLCETYSCFRISDEQFSQLGRDKPGIGNKGHAALKRKIRELGWLRPNNNHLVRVKALNKEHQGFSPIGILDEIQRRYDMVHASEPSRRWSFSDWLTDRTPPEYRVLALQTMLNANSQVGTLGAAVVVEPGTDMQALSETIESLGVQQRAVANVWLIGAGLEGVSRDEGIEVLASDQPWPKVLSERISRGDDVPDFVWILHAGDRLVPHATLLHGEYRLRLPDPLVWYVDEAVLEAGKLDRPLLKPDFNIDLLRSYPYVGRSLLLSTAAIQALGGLEEQFGDLAPIDMVWRLVEAVGPSVVGHVPELLVETRLRLSEWTRTDEIIQAFPRLVQGHLQRLGIEAQSVPAERKGIFRVEYPVVVQPLVSIIVPTRDQAAVLGAFIDGLIARTRYRNFEVLIVDDNSSEEAAMRLLAELEGLGVAQLRVLRWCEPFNFAAMNNFAVEQARGEVLLFLNNDIQFTQRTREDWLERMLANVLRPEVGIVGARLDLPGGRVDQCGQLLGVGDSVGLAFHGHDSQSEGYLNRLILQQNVSATSASCMMMRRDLFEELGGLNAEQFAIYYADVDICLKALEAGYLVSLEPDTGLGHMGGASRLLTRKFGLHTEPTDHETDRLYERWLPRLKHDPYYHPAFSRSPPGYALSPDASRIYEPLPGRPLPVVLVVHADWHGCGHYRILHPFQAMASEFRLEGGAKLGDFQFLDVAKVKPDTIVLQGAWDNENILTKIRRYKELVGAKIVFEIYDYLPNIPTRSIYRGQVSQGLLKKMRRAIEEVDWLVVSTTVLAEEYSSYHPDIRVAANGLLPAWWKDLRSQRRTGRKIRVGWAGGSSHAGDLAEIRPVIHDLQDEVEWVFMGMKPDGVSCEFHPGVSIQDYPEKLAGLNLDLAVVPLEVNQFNRCKSNLRLLELGVCGIPVIATDIDPYRCGLPVALMNNRPQEWVAAIREHISDPEALASKGDRLREAVLRDWMLEGDFLNQWQRAWLGSEGAGY